MRSSFGRFGGALFAITTTGAALSSLGCAANVDEGSAEATETPPTEIVGRVSNGLSIGANIFWDGFDGGSLNRGNWNVQSSVTNDACSSSGGPFNGEVQRYQDREGCSLSDHNICVSNGTLKLVARRQDTSACNGSYAKYTSGRINSKRKREFNPWSGPAGVRIEARIRMPAGINGNWPAFWTLGSDIKQGPRMWNGTDDNDWPDCGEVDIAEAGWNWGGGQTSLNTLHFGTQNWSSYDGQYHDQRGGGSTGIGRYQWHTYAVEWTPSNMTWYRDGGWTGSVNISSIPNQDFEHNHFILLNLAMGGAGGGSANAPDSYFPKNGTSYMWEQVMEIDYVRVDKLNY
jgi:beta-glucanase (GH16 family)